MSLPCYVGVLYLSYLFLKFLKLVFSVVSGALFGKAVDFRRLGEWAVVTGCTDGIGKAYAKQLAAKGLNIVLMSRSKDKLNAVASEIENEFKVKTKIIQVDFSGGYEIYKPIGKELEGLEIGVLVNNVGMALFHPEFLYDIPVETIWSQINVNVLSTAMLTRMILPSMAERKKGVIINVASAAAVFTTPLLGTYSGTKAFMDKFSESLQLEYAEKGVIIQSVMPLVVATNMSRVKKSSLSSPSPDLYVKSVLAKVGNAKRCHGYWPHECEAFIASSLPEWIRNKIVLFSVKKMREKGIAKKKAKKES